MTLVQSTTSQFQKTVLQCRHCRDTNGDELLHSKGNVSFESCNLERETHDSFLGKYETILHEFTLRREVAVSCVSKRRYSEVITLWN